MPTVSLQYATPITLTITLASLASDTSLSAGRASAAVDNSTNGYVDFVVGGKVTTGTSPTASRQIEVWAFGTYDGTTYSAGASGSDAAFSPGTEKPLMKLLQIIPTDNTSNRTYEWGPCSVAQAFGGTCPLKWGIYVVHNTGVGLNATAGNHEVKATPVKYASA
ncbi:MAG TPA: hypothetical protein VNK48_08100 [Xanthobacteraceae bacterium]|nr:hypothetical protein [Xanthobacteraceae bacterium]